MQGGWYIINFMITQATRGFLFPSTSQMVHYFIIWMRIAREWKLITLSYLLIPKLGVLIISVYGIPMDFFESSSSYNYTRHLCSKFSPLSLEESGFWSCALIFYLFGLKLGFMIKSIYFWFFKQELIPWYYMYP